MTRPATLPARLAPAGVQQGAGARPRVRRSLPDRGVAVKTMRRPRAHRSPPEPPEASKPETQERKDAKTRRRKVVLPYHSMAPCASASWRLRVFFS
jgi:hypothetical protein